MKAPGRFKFPLGAFLIFSQKRGNGYVHSLMRPNPVKGKKERHEDSIKSAF
jgi:hypothetical protein